MADSDRTATVEDRSEPGDALFRVGILMTATIVTGLYAMTVTIANVALPQMQGALAATTDQIAWVVTSYIVATAMVTPTAGWLASRFGRRRTMLWAVIGFTVSTILCGAANTLVEVVVFRAFQGAFGAPLPPIAQATILDTFPKHQQSTALTVYGMGIVLGPIIAPTLGGYLSEYYTWRWVFYMVVPVGLLSFVGVWYFIRARAGERQKIRLDWTGFLALCIAVGAFQLMLDRGERADWFSSAEIVIEACVALIAFYIFIVQTFTAQQPFLSPRMLLDRNFAIGILVTLIFGMLFVTPLVLLPPLLRDLRGYPDITIGLLLAMRSLGTLGGFICILFVAKRVDPRLLLAAGFSLQAVAGYFMAQFDINLTSFGVAWTNCLQGFGTGLIWVPLMTITFATLDAKYIPDGAAVFHLVRNIGTSIFISISIAVVIRTAKINYSTLVENATPFNDALMAPGVQGSWSLENLNGLTALATEIQRQSLMIGYINGFYLFAITAAAVVPLLLLVRRGRPTPP
jgi:DHA2 family multidrug resistance protein